VHFIGLYCIIISQCTEQKHKIEENMLTIQEVEGNYITCRKGGWSKLFRKLGSPGGLNLAWTAMIKQSLWKY